MKRLVPALLCWFGASLGADLKELRDTQDKLIAARDSNKLPRDETPLAVVALAKQQLLEWAESRLETFPSDADPNEITKQFSGELHRATKPVSRDDLDQLGALDISFSRPQGAPKWIQMSTDIGIQCGYDRSVYLFEWRDKRWNRRFTFETDDYSQTEYNPQQEFELEISSPDTRGARLVFVTGLPPACMSVWHTLYIRLYRIGASQKLLLNEAPLANLGQDGPAYTAHLEKNGIRIAYFGRSIDSGLLIRKHVLRYALEGGEVRRLDPIAYSPRDFVDEWLTRSWNEVSDRSEPRITEWHRRLHKEFVNGDFEAIQACTKRGELQVSINIDEKAYYFFVQERGQDRFRMTEISGKPREDCSGPNELSDH